MTRRLACTVAASLTGLAVGLLLSSWLAAAAVRPRRSTDHLEVPPQPKEQPLRPRPAAAIRETSISTAPSSLSSPPPPPPPPPPRSTEPAASSVGPFDLDNQGGLRAAAAARAARGEIVTFSSDQLGLPSAANMALQLRRLRIEHHLVLSDSRATCDAAHRSWAWLGCGWSAGLPGFEAKYALGVGGSTTKLWSLWSAKWLLVARLTELRLNVLALDTDMLLQANPYARRQASSIAARTPCVHSPRPPLTSPLPGSYPLLCSAPLDRFHMVIVPEGSRVNLGFLYVRGRQARPGGGTASVLWDVVRRLRLFTEDWPLLDRKGRTTSTAGLWDQGLFTDAIASAVRGEQIYPCARRLLDRREVERRAQALSVRAGTPTSSLRRLPSGRRSAGRAATSASPTCPRCMRSRGTAGRALGSRSCFERPWPGRRSASTAWSRARPASPAAAPPSPAAPPHTTPQRLLPTHLPSGSSPHTSLLAWTGTRRDPPSSSRRPPTRSAPTGRSRATRSSGCPYGNSTPQRTSATANPQGEPGSHCLAPRRPTHRRAPSCTTSRPALLMSGRFTPGWLDPAARLTVGAAPSDTAQRRVSRAARSRTGDRAGGAPTELLSATPDWLYCLVGRWAITAGWPSLSPGASCAVLHLVESRSQFGGWQAFKSSRPYVMRALGHWHLPEPEPNSAVQGGRPLAVRLAASEWREVAVRVGQGGAQAYRGRLPGRRLGAAGRAGRRAARQAERTRFGGEGQGVGQLLNTLQRLALVAAVTGRAPVVPSVRRDHTEITCRDQAESRA